MSGPNASFDRRKSQMKMSFAKILSVVFTNHVEVDIGYKSVVKAKGIFAVIDWDNHVIDPVEGIR